MLGWVLVELWLSLDGDISQLSNSSLSLKTRSWLCFTLSQEEEEEQQEQQEQAPPKSNRSMLTTGEKFGT